MRTDLLAEMSLEDQHLYEKTDHVWVGTQEELDHWVGALRSGRFKQTCGQLGQQRNGKTYYCCLGVAGAVLDNRIVLVPEYDGPDTDLGWLAGNYLNEDLDFLEDEEDDEDGTVMIDFLPEGLLFLDSGTQRILSKMNDDLEFSFSEIADWIESHIIINPYTKTFVTIGVENQE